MSVLNDFTKKFRRKAHLMILMMAEAGRKIDNWSELYGYKSESQLKRVEWTENKDGSKNIVFELKGLTQEQLFHKNTIHRFEFRNIKLDPSTLGAKTGEPKVVNSTQEDSAKVLVDNLSGDNDVSKNYTVNWGESTSVSESFTKGFKQAIEATAGGTIPGGVNVEVKVSSETSQELQNAKEQTKDISQSTSFDMVTKAGTKKEGWHTRMKTDIEQEIEYYGDYLYKIRIVQVKPRFNDFKSMADFIDLIRGNASDRTPFNDGFRPHPASEHMVKRLLNAGTAYNKGVLKYNGATTSTLRVKVLETKLLSLALTKDQRNDLLDALEIAEDNAPSRRERRSIEALLDVVRPGKD